MDSVATRPFFGKRSLVDLLPDLRPGTKERHGPCPFCGGEDRFMVFLDSGRGYCRKCNWCGDSLAFVMDRDRFSFRQAQRQLGLDTRTSPSFKRKAAIHSFALAAAKRSYLEWERDVFRALLDQYQELNGECDIAEVAYRAIHRVPELYTLQERRYWTHRLAELYDRIAIVEHDLDLLTYTTNELARLAWWRASEVRHG